MSVAKTKDDAPLYDPEAEGFYQDPYAHYARVRAAEPVYWSDQRVWIVTGYKEAAAVLRDRRFSAHHFDFGSAGGEEIDPQVMEALEAVMVGVPVFMDPPDHTRLRTLVSKAFTPRAVDALRPRIQEFVDSFLDEVADAGEMDVVRDVAQRLPLMVICEIVGIPHEDHGQFRQWAEDVSQMGNVDQTMDVMMQTFMSFVQMRQYMSDVVAARRAQPGDTLLDALIAAEEAGDRLTSEEVSGFAVNLLLAGYDTTMSFISSATYTLLRNPELAARIRSDPGALGKAIEEMLRHESPVQVTVAPRLATEDIEVGGKVIRKGDTVRVILGAANRDPSEFPDPDSVDIDRFGDANHIAFGLGVHTCLGSHLARLESQVALSTLFDRMPNLRLATEQPRWVDKCIIRRLESLPVTF